MITNIQYPRYDEVNYKLRNSGPKTDTVHKSQLSFYEEREILRGMYNSDLWINYNYKGPINNVKLKELRTGLIMNNILLRNGGVGLYYKTEYPDSWAFYTNISDELTFAGSRVNDSSSHTTGSTTYRGTINPVFQIIINDSIYSDPIPLTIKIRATYSFRNAYKND